MPATDSAMASPMGSSESGTSAAMGQKWTSGWATPGILGTLIFGMITILTGLWILPHPYGDGFKADVTGIAFMGYAAAALLLFVGVVAFLEGHQFWGTAFLGYAGFWGAWSYALHHFGWFGSGYGAAGFAFIWMLFTLTFLVSSLKHGWGAVFAFLLLWVAFVLLIIAFWQTGAGTHISNNEYWAIGGEWVFTGLVWWYGGLAQLTNHTYGKKILPT
ncbi:MAG TPA: GPR1/FUN34/YaaH family transporter [Thermoplasmata archaeon]|nr:GPR1/FUN34/YaaH family transporter [Thermoplasmata archaeon]